jgi:hypothetical protein
MKSSQPPLDARKYGWHYGDVVTLGFQKSGFVINSTPAYLEVAWMPDCVTERLGLAEAESLLRVAHAASLSPTSDKTNVEVLETMLALRKIEIAIRERVASCKTLVEAECINQQIQRCFNEEGCDWDKAHGDQLLQLAIEPSKVGILFKLQERMHRIVCRQH